MKEIEAVIFDMDGLLLDSERIALKAFQTTCRKFGLDDLGDLFISCIGTNAAMGTAILKKGLAGLADFEEFDREWNTEYRKATEKTPVPLKNGAKELLTYLQASRIPRAVATSTATDRAKGKLERSGILKYFETIIGGDQVSQSKPDPEIYLKAASALSVNPAKCLALEDSANGVKSAVAAGMVVVQIPDLVEPDETLLRLGHVVYLSLLDVLRFQFLNLIDKPFR